MMLSLHQSADNLKRSDYPEQGKFIMHRWLKQDLLCWAWKILAVT